MARRAGQIERRRRPTPAKPKKGKRPRLAEVEALWSTYAAPKPEGAKFVKARADHAVRWIETNLRHYKGRWGGPSLLPAAVAEAPGPRALRLAAIRRNAALSTRLRGGTRKSGKSMLAAAIGLYMAYGDGEAGPEVAFAAYDQEQAKICYGAARFMIEANEALYEQTVISNSALE